MAGTEKMLAKAYGDSEGPLGFPMVPEAAKELETALSEMDGDCKSYLKDRGGDNGLIRVRAVPAAFELREGERADVSLITTDSTDRDKEVVLPGGGNWKTFIKGGGPVTFAHKYSELPVGRAAWLKRTKEPMDGWLAKTLYKSAPANWNGPWYPDAVFAFVQDGMKGKSIGFIPTKGHQPNDKDLENEPRMAEVDFVIDKWIGLEYAVAPIQANPDAVTIAVSKMAEAGIEVPDFVMDEMGILVPERVVKSTVDQKDTTITITVDGDTTVATEDVSDGADTKQAFACECIECGYKMESEEHCKDLSCPECGGQMRREERPGPGQASATPPQPPQRAKPRVIPPSEAAGSRTPKELEQEMMDAGLIAADSLDIDAIARAAVERIQGRV